MGEGNGGGQGHNRGRLVLMPQQVTVFLTSMGDFVEMNSEYEKWFTHKPARSCVAVKELPKGVPVEMECVALP